MSSFKPNPVSSTDPAYISRCNFENDALKHFIFMLFDSKYPTESQNLRSHNQSANLDDPDSLIDFFTSCGLNSMFDPLVYAAFYQRFKTLAEAGKIKAQASYLRCVESVISHKECCRIADTFWVESKTKNPEIMNYLSPDLLQREADSGQPDASFSLFRKIIFKSKEEFNAKIELPIALRHLNAALAVHNPEAVYSQLILKKEGIDFVYGVDDPILISQQIKEMEKDADSTLLEFRWKIEEKFPSKVIPGFHWRGFVDWYSMEFVLPLLFILSTSALGIFLESTDLLMTALTVCPYLCVSIGFGIVSKSIRKKNIPLCGCNIAHMAHDKWVEHIPESVGSLKRFPEDKAFHNFITIKIILEWLFTWTGIILSFVYIDSGFIKALSALISYFIGAVFLSVDVDITAINEYLKLIIAPIVAPIFCRNHRQCRLFLEEAEDKYDVDEEV